MINIKNNRNIYLKI